MIFYPLISVFSKILEIIVLNFYNFRIHLILL